MMMMIGDDDDDDHDDDDDSDDDDDDDHDQHGVTNRQAYHRATKELTDKDGIYCRFW